VTSSDKPTNGADRMSKEAISHFKRLGQIRLGREAVMMEDAQALAKEKRRQDRLAADVFFRSMGLESEDEGIEDPSMIVIGDEIRFHEPAKSPPRAAGSPVWPIVVAAALGAGGLGAGGAALAIQQWNKPTSPAPITVETPAIQYELMLDLPEDEAN
jgi:hypothetical protein